MNKNYKSLYEAQIIFLNSMYMKLFGIQTWRQSAPSTSEASGLSCCSWKVVSRWQASWLNIIVKFQRRIQFDNNPIIVKRITIIWKIIVWNDLRNTSYLEILKFLEIGNHKIKRITTNLSSSLLCSRTSSDTMASIDITMSCCQDSAGIQNSAYVKRNSVLKKHYSICI